MVNLCRHVNPSQNFPNRGRINQVKCIINCIQIFAFVNVTMDAAYVTSQKQAIREFFQFTVFLAMKTQTRGTYCTIRQKL